MVVITTKGEGKDAKPVVKELPAGFVLWSTGIGNVVFLCRHKHPADGQISYATVHEALGRVAPQPIPLQSCPGRRIPAS